MSKILKKKKKIHWRTNPYVPVTGELLFDDCGQESPQKEVTLDLENREHMCPSS
jgi:hypothetical protein